MNDAVIAFFDAYHWKEAYDPYPYADVGAQRSWIQRVRRPPPGLTPAQGTVKRTLEAGRAWGPSRLEWTGSETGPRMTPVGKNYAELAALRERERAGYVPRRRRVPLSPERMEELKQRLLQSYGNLARLETSKEGPAAAAGARAEAQPPGTKMKTVRTRWGTVQVPE